jgi:RNA polymerase sigma-70 factor (ECF subfamily)
MARTRAWNIVDLAMAREERTAECASSPVPDVVEQRPIEPYGKLIDRIYRDHNEALVRFLYAKLRSEQDAREVAQEAYVRMLKLDEPDTVKHLQAYLFRTAANLAVDRLRQSRRQPALRVLEDGAAEASSPQPGQDAVLEWRQKLALLDCAISELPPKCRKAFLLYKFEGQSYSEIANKMELSESMVRKYVIRAIVYCRERLGDEL